MASMFSGAIAFNQNIGSWSTLNVERMENMFQNATAFNQDISDWNVSNVNNFTDFMTGKTPTDYSPENLDSIYNGWSSRPVQPNVSISFGTIIYTAAGQAGKDILTGATNNWTCVDGGVLRTETFEFTVKTDNAGVSTSTQFKLPLVNSLPLYAVVDWGDGSSDTITVFNQPEITHTYNTTTTTEFTISITGNLSGWQFGGGGDRLKMLNVSQWAGLTISINFGFWGCENMTCTATDAPLITSTSLFRYFENCTNFNGAIGNWDVSNVTSMTFMFSNNLSFNQDISPWITSSVESMASMFSGAILFNQNIGSWSTLNVTRMENMFSNATAFNNNGSDDIDNWRFSTTSNINMSGMFSGTDTTLSCKFNRYIGSWNTERVTNMSSMFANNTAFNQNINTKTINAGLPNEYVAWDTSNVTSIVSMFSGASVFNQNIGSWNMSNVTNFSSMFLNATEFNQNIGAWDVSKVTNFENMFSNATAFNNNGSDDIDNWTFSTTSNINMSRMFSGTNTTLSCKFNRYIGSWNTQRVTNMSFMFLANTAFNQNINTKTINAGLPNEYVAWVTSNVTFMIAMFHTASSFNGDISAWDTSKVTLMNEMFQTASSFNQDISTKIVTIGSTTYTAWDVSKVTNMGIMFRNAVVFNQNIGNWDTSSVTAMNSMFQDIPAFNQDIGNWNVSNVINFSNFMLGRTAANYSAQNLASIYNQWSQLTLKPNLNINFNTIDYCDTAEANKQSIVTNFGWVITDGNAVPC